MYYKYPIYMYYKYSIYIYYKYPIYVYYKYPIHMYYKYSIYIIITCIINTHKNVLYVIQLSDRVYNVTFPA